MFKTQGNVNQAVTNIPLGSFGKFMSFFAYVIYFER